ncbi:putative N-acetyltransferase YhbS [Halopolyspora algeriensis]|uniref:Putative N-acetyltransferase YhbS n=1 Tax=Halopolyspora algeriensis TaxID=1500506 RepID=A0A368VDA4_9ACTN|nr:GNAT family N-acetyltransferase [Halopolyspora algeriensis]RCW39118.1 putative N-acetyltransferase YhbS [Halopolyspora algeriensis]TQM56584.1 putative N-acetyltransferase YhbS [Halopolyspora algeriensis]
MSTVTIRAARPEDLDAVGEVTARAYMEGGHIGDRSDYLGKLRDAADRAEKAELLVAVEGDKVLGSVTVARDGTEYTEMARPGEIEFRMLAVAPEAAGRGVGRCLVRAVLDRARAEEWSRVVLCSQESMAVAHRLYRSLGFERAPERDWWPHPDLPLLAFVLESK